MKENFDNIYFSLNELKEVLIFFKKSIPEDLHKILLDHAINTLQEVKELEVKVNDICSKTRDNC